MHHIVHMTSFDYTLASLQTLWENKMCQWISFKFSAIKLFSQSFGELTRYSQNISCGQCDVSECLAYRHIVKSIVKELEEKNQKFRFFGTWTNFNQVWSSHAICHALQCYSQSRRLLSYHPFPKNRQPEWLYRRLCEWRCYASMVRSFFDTVADAPCEWILTFINEFHVISANCFTSSFM